MPDLLDANVWLALSAPDHTHHTRARQYWDEQAAESTGFCRLTALALLRHLCAREIFGAAALSGEAAWRSLQEWLALPAVHWWDEPAGLDEWLRQWSARVPLRGGDWTDAYLAAFAAASGHRLVSFDRGFRRFSGLDCLLLTTAP